MDTLSPSLPIAVVSKVSANSNAVVDQDAPEEERQEGYPILLNGLWCIGHR